MEIQFKDLQADVSVSCAVGRISIPGTYRSIGYLKVTGTYKYGSAGRPDAEHIVGMTCYAKEVLGNRKWLLDLSELSYVWGDEIDWVLEGGDAIVVGPECMPAISTLGDLDAEPDACLDHEDVFDNLSEAFDYLKNLEEE